MSPHILRWDPSSPPFINDVMRMMILLGLVVNIVFISVFRQIIFGILVGAAFAILLYLIAMQAGNVFTRTKNYSRVMRWLLLSQFVLWVGMALLFGWVKTNPVGFVIGVSILPASIVLTLFWYFLQGRRSS